MGILTLQVNHIVELYPVSSITHTQIFHIFCLIAKIYYQYQAAIVIVFWPITVKVATIFFDWIFVVNTKAGYVFSPNASVHKSYGCTQGNILDTNDRIADHCPALGYRIFALY